MRGGGGVELRVRWSALAAALVAGVLATEVGAKDRGADGSFEKRVSSHFALYQDVDIDRTSGLRGSRNFENQVLETLEAAYDRLDHYLALRPSRRMDVVIYDPQIFDQHFAGMFRFAAAGFYSGTIHVRGGVRVDAALIRTLHHEDERDDHPRRQGEEPDFDRQRLGRRAQLPTRQPPPQSRHHQKPDREETHEPAPRGSDRAFEPAAQELEARFERRDGAPVRQQVGAPPEDQQPGERHHKGRKAAVRHPVALPSADRRAEAEPHRQAEGRVPARADGKHLHLHDGHCHAGKA